ncbi:hypothetical protein PI124_g19482 [Phytophthora idaei]|nr:hypothetical protein PI125_g20521 [Phytophthora idaei]KAG3133610.1 hypothetical protein PI126_g19093 [Phytophthora idaei]KAG3235484.1 hypothetical protein PI124_g19482 [Phytophthora idaei]
MATCSAAFGVDPAWNEWFKLNLRCSQRTFELLCKLRSLHLFHLASSDGYRETAAAMGVSKECATICRRVGANRGRLSDCQRVSLVRELWMGLLSKSCDTIIPTGGTTTKDKHHSIFKLCAIIEKLLVI